MTLSLKVGLIPAVFLLLSLLPESLSAQAWKFEKEKDGIRVYTRKESGQSIRSYKGIADIKAPADKIFSMLEDVNHTDWWDKSVTNIKVLAYEKNKSARYYLVYDLPWPVTDRDLCVDVIVVHDPATGERQIVAGPLIGVIPEKDGYIRIRHYRQVWTVRAAGANQSHVTLEGHVDPAGSIPDLISNMVVVDSPMKVIGEVKRRMEASAN